MHYVYNISPNIEWVASSMIGQWIYIFFRRGHLKIYNRPAILVSLESTGPYQCNGASLVFMHVVILEIAIITKLSPHYVLTESTISSL